MFLIKVSSIGILCSLIGFVKLNMRMLGMLISLEALMLMLLVFLYGSLVVLGTSLHYFLVLLTFAACEAALGLSLLVSVLRLRGNDYVSSFSSLNFYV